jgi:hypothetical protein
MLSLRPVDVPDVGALSLRSALGPRPTMAWLGDWVLPTMTDSPATTRCPQCLALVPDVHGPVHKYVRAAPGCCQMFGELQADELQRFGYPPAHRLVATPTWLIVPATAATDAIANRYSFTSPGSMRCSSWGCPRNAPPTYWGV